MDDPELVDRLAQHHTLGAAPREELAWLAGHGYLRHMEEGEFVTRKTELLDTLAIVLTGHFSIYVDRGAGPRKVMEWSAGDVGGFLPYSRMTNPPGDAVMDEPGDIFFVHRDHFPELIRACPTVTTALVHAMVDRARRFTSSDLQDEKMMSLGRLTAGVAHELNNPASAAARSAKLFVQGLTTLEDASRALGASGLSDAQLAAINRSRQACLSAAPSALAPVERADREDAMASWLDAHGADPGAAAALADTAVTFEDLETLASTLADAALNTTLEWMAADCTSRALAADVERAATRIHDLVASMKRFSYMDQTSVPEAVDLGMSVRDALALLLHKARKKSVGVGVTLPPGQRVLAIGGDLSQVWMNLIDNAIDAVSESGHVTVTAERSLDRVIVRVADDGPGIAPEIRGRIFDPFVTTKPVGQGTGLGLDIARQLVRRNDGDIEFDSRPGRTEFRVTLPAVPDGSSS